MLLLKPVVGERPLLNSGINDETSDVCEGKRLTINTQWYFQEIRGWTLTIYVSSHFFLLPDFPIV